MSKSKIEKGDKARLISTRNNWMLEVRKKVKDSGVDPESSPEYLLAIEVGELFGEAMRTRLTSIPSSLFEERHSTQQLHDTLSRLLGKDKKNG